MAELNRQRPEPAANERSLPVQYSAAQAAGRRIECADAWIAATALLYNAPLVTHNRADYLGVPGLSMISHGDQPR